MTTHMRYCPKSEEDLLPVYQTIERTTRKYKKSTLPKYTTCHSTGRAMITSSEMRKGNVELHELMFRGREHGICKHGGQLIE